MRLQFDKIQNTMDVELFQIEYRYTSCNNSLQYEGRVNVKEMKFMLTYIFNLCKQ